MSQPRSITHQINRAIVEHTAIGHSKRGERAAGVNTMLRIYSHGRDGKHGELKDLRDLSRQFGQWMQANHPEIRLAKDITSEHVSEYLLDESAHHWSDSTYNKQLSLCGKLGQLVGDTYRSRSSWTAGITRLHPDQSDKQRCVCFTAHERQQIRDDAASSRSEALKAAAFGSYFGLRVGSIPSVRVQDIYSDHIHIERDKGGRSRDIYYSSPEQAKKAQQALQWAINHGRTNGRENVFNVRPGSIGRAVQRCCARHLISTAKSAGSSVHALRKSYARERYEQEYSKRYNGQSPYMDWVDKTERHALDNRYPGEQVKYDAAAWDVVADELGHGKGRTDLYRAYIVDTQS